MTGAAPAVAVIPAAGLGTRFLPATKAVPKEMLPIVDRPAIDYAMAEAVAAGITEVVVVTGKGKGAIQEYFSRDRELEAALEAAGKPRELEAVRRPAEMASVRYVVQAEPRGLGHAVWTAREAVGNRPFAVLLPDEIHDPALLREMLRVFAKRAGSVIAVAEMEPEEVVAYGVVDPEPVADGLVRVRGIVEKPALDEAPSNLGSVGRYVFTPAILDALGRVTPGVGGEIQLTDGIQLLAASEPVFAQIVRTRRFDVGRKLDFLKATVELALDREDLAPELARFLRDLVARRVG